MPAEMQFSNNYRDLSVPSGTDSGFQFEFDCQRCNDRWRTTFKPYRSGQASGWADKGAYIFGSLLGSAGSVLRGLAQAGWHSARDDAFKDAVAAAKTHFNRCGKCHGHVCAQCFDPSSGLCFDCAPSVRVAIAAARAAGEAQGASANAADEGMRRGAAHDVRGALQLVCPTCRSETHGARFCPECGHKMAQQVQCVACPALLEPGTRFCTECGQRQDEGSAARRSD